MLNEPLAQKIVLSALAQCGVTAIRRLNVAACWCAQDRPPSRRRILEIAEAAEEA
jgi:hypothetical protein